MIDETNEHQEIEKKPPKATSNRASYEIHVKDHLDPCWCQWFEGWSLSNLGNGEVSLCRSDVDQSALHGALNKIFDLNLTLLSVRRNEKNDLSIKSAG